MPREWNYGVIFPLYNKGYPLIKCHNYRGISLLNLVCKILSFTVYMKLLPHVGKGLGSRVRVDSAEEIYNRPKFSLHKFSKK